MEKLPSPGCYLISDFLSTQEHQTILNELRELNINEPQKFKFAKPTPPSAIELEREETQSSLRPYVDKLNCYSMEITGKDQVPEVLKNTVPYALESATKGSHFKAHYRRFRFDFYKPGGCSKGAEKVVMKQEKRTKKNIITYFGLCLGDPIELEFKLNDWTFKKTLSSGQAIFIDQSV